MLYIPIFYRSITFEEPPRVRFSAGAKKKKKKKANSNKKNSRRQDHVHEVTLFVYFLMR